MIKPFSLGCGQNEATATLCDSQFQTMLTKAEELGVNYVKMNAETDGKLTARFVDQVNKARLKLILVLDRDTCPEIDLETFFQDQNLYRKGYDWGKDTALKNFGKVEYYQIANEISGTTLARDTDQGSLFPNTIGNAKFAYAKYIPLRTWMKGVYDGVKAVDKNAKIAVSGHWVLVAVFDELIKDGIHFDVLQWNWYSGDDDIEAWNIDGKEYDVLGDYLNKYGTEVWIGEANRPGGDFDGNSTAQAEAIEQMAQKIYQSKKASGFVVFYLNDHMNPEGEMREADKLGLINIKESNNFKLWELGSDKSAFFAYQKVIAENHYMSWYQPSVVQRWLNNW